jgi:hypothetical protein
VAGVIDHMLKVIQLGCGFRLGHVLRLGNSFA